MLLNLMLSWPLVLARLLVAHGVVVAVAGQ